MFSKVWDTFTGNCIHSILYSHIVRAVAFPSQPGVNILATGGFEKRLMIYDLSQCARSPQSGHSGVEPPRHGFVGTSVEGIRTIQNTTTAPGFEIGPHIHTAAIRSILWGKDTNIIITACEDRKLRWFDIRARRAEIASYTFDGPIGSSELNPAQTILSVAAGKTAYFFSTTDPGQVLKSATFPKEVASAAFHETERKFVTGGSQDTWVKVWDMEADGTGDPLDVWKGHHGPVWSLSFSPDEKICASGSEDGTVKLWKFCEGGYGLWK